MNWVRCRYCSQERKIRNGRMVRHRKWNPVQRKMEWCQGSGDKL